MNEKKPLTKKWGDRLVRGPVGQRKDGGVLLPGRSRMTRVSHTVPLRRVWYHHLLGPTSSPQSYIPTHPVHAHRSLMWSHMPVRGVFHVSGACDNFPWIGEKMRKKRILMEKLLCPSIITFNFALIPSFLFFNYLVFMFDPNIYRKWCLNFYKMSLYESLLI